MWAKIAEHRLFLARYWLARWLMSACLWVMPRGRYRDELMIALYDLKANCIFEVERDRATRAQL